MPDQTGLRDALHDLVADVHADDALRHRIERSGRPPHRRPLVLLAAAVLVAMALVATVLALVHDDDPTPVTTTPGSRWHEIAPAPTPPRDGASVVWTGKEVLIWGGTKTGRDGEKDGAAYDPTRDTWRRMADAPIDGRFDAVTAWTGSELVVWGGSSGETGEPRSDGAAYDPARNRWRVLAAAPVPARATMAYAWTGSQLFVWGGDGHDHGAAYDPTADSWSAWDAGLPTMGEPHLTWRGSPGDQYLVAWDGATGVSYALYENDAGSRLNPLGGLPSQPRLHAAISTTPGAITWGGHDERGWQADGWRLSGTGWEPLPVTPKVDAPAPGLKRRLGAWLADSFVVWPERLRYSSGAWTRLPDPHLPVSRPLAVVATDEDLLVWSGSGDEGEVRGARLHLESQRRQAPVEAAPPPVCPPAHTVVATALPAGWSEDVSQERGRWRGPDGARVDIGTEAALRLDERIEALGSPGTLGEWLDGLGAQLECGISIEGHGIDRTPFRRLVTGLRDPAAPFALWPEHTPAAAAAASPRLARGEDRWRGDRDETALRFAAEVLGWDDAVVTGEDQWGQVHLSSGRSDVFVSLARLVGGEWWSVTGVSDPDLGEGGGALADATHAEMGGSVAELTACRGDRCATGRSGIVDVAEPWDVSQPGSLLALLKDADGTVIHAWGILIGPGEFAAG